MPQITFTAYLKAAPQGSKRHVGRGVMVESSTAVGPYRQNLAETAWVKRGALGFDRIDFGVPVGISLDFYFLRPKTAKRRKEPTVKPDLDKLIRSTLDALMGILYGDDCQVCEVNARKHYCTVERVEISCYTLSPDVPAFQKEVRNAEA